MGSQILSPLLAPLTSLNCVSSKEAPLLEKLCGPSVLDVCYHFPSQIEWREWHDSVLSPKTSSKSTLIVQVDYHVPSVRKRPYQIFCSHGTENIILTFFNGNPAYLQKILPPKALRLISGTLEKKLGEWQMVHPDHIGLPDEKNAWIGERTLYPLTQNITQKGLRKVIQDALSRIPMLPEWIPSSLVQQEGWPSWREAILSLHQAKEKEDLDLQSAALKRLAFDEILAHQYMLRLTQAEQNRTPGLIFNSSGIYEAQLLPILPFSLTNGQKQALQEILQDTQTGHRMMRLLQGDVGSGKTIVSFIALLHALEAGHQGAYLAPTEILAQQHYQRMKQWCDHLGITIELFTSAMKGKNRQRALDQLKVGKIALAVGTHSLLEDDVHFQSLGFVVIDEQHRFGVDQRSRLLNKGPQSHTLIMTATPIPRTLALTLYGDIPISVLHEKPANRVSIATRLLPISRLQDVYDGLQRILEKRQKIYWVCPLIEEGAEETIGHVEKRFHSLEKIFGKVVGFLHGRLKSQEKEKIMKSFSEGEIQILVATSVVEVGMDVPSATVIVIENAELFGLFQLHQLRGRVGRSDLPSACVLLYKSPLSAIAKKRLEILRESNDGFKISEMDLRLRGGGDFFGTKQSGLPNFRFFRFDQHHHLLPLASSTARVILKQSLEKDELLKILLALFKSEQVEHYLRIG